MKILIVNTSERTGGAAVAANRLMKALNNHGVKAKMLVRDKESDTLTVAQLPKSPMKRWHFLWERLVVFCHLHFSKQHLFEIDIANAGTDITKLREFEPTSFTCTGSTRACCRSAISVRFCAAASPWYGPCTTFGPPPASVTSHLTVASSPQAVATAACCQAMVQTMISPTRHGRRSWP